MMYAIIRLMIFFVLSSQLSSSQKAMTGPVWGRHGAVQGVYRQMPGTGRVAAFLGIPYAAPPVGDKRFRHASPPSNWVGVHRADEPGPACPQSQVPHKSKEYREILQQQSEDCLYLNIYSPGEECERELSEDGLLVEGVVCGGVGEGRGLLVEGLVRGGAC